MVRDSIPSRPPTVVREIRRQRHQYFVMFTGPITGATTSCDEVPR